MPQCLYLVGLSFNEVEILISFNQVIEIACIFDNFEDVAGLRRLPALQLAKDHVLLCFSGNFMDASLLDERDSKGKVQTDIQAIE